MKNLSLHLPKPGGHWRPWPSPGSLANRLAAWLTPGSTPFYALLYLAGVALAETVTALVHPQLGLVLHGLLLVLILLHASLSVQVPRQKFLLSLSLAPLIRLLSLSMPVAQFEQYTWYLIIGAPLFLAAVIAARLVGASPRQVGFALGRQLPLQAGIALSGLLLGYVEYRILKPAPLAEAFTWQQVLVPALILLVFTGLLEELIFRGLLQHAALLSLGRGGILFVAALFAVMHIGYRSVADVGFVFAVGLLFGYVTHRSGSILGVTLAHGLTNITLFLVFPFLV